MTLGLIVLFDSNAIMSLSTSVTGKKTNCLAILENFYTFSNRHSGTTTLPPY